MSTISLFGAHRCPPISLHGGERDCSVLNVVSDEITTHIFFDDFNSLLLFYDSIGREIEIAKGKLEAMKEASEEIAVVLNGIQPT